MPKVTIGGQLVSNARFANIDSLYGPYGSMSEAVSALGNRLDNPNCVGLTVGIKQSDSKVKEYWVQPKGTTPETYGLVEKGVGTTDYNDLDNKPTISDGGQGSQQIPLSGNVKVTATAAGSGQTTGVTVTAENGGITMAFTLEKGAEGETGPQGNDGKSAFEVWKETTGRPTATEPEYIADLQTKVVRWIPVAYEALSPAPSIGDTVTFTTAPSNPIDGAIVLMPNGSSATATMMFAVSEDTNTPGTYIYTYIGDLNVDTTGLLGSSDVDNTKLANPAPNALAKAEDVMPLAAKLDGVSFERVKLGIVSNSFVNNSAVSNTGSPSQTLNYDRALYDVEGYEKVEFLGLELASSVSRGYAFSDASDSVVKAYGYDIGDIETSQLKRYIVDVPDGIKYIRLNVAYRGENVNFTFEDFYCYGLKGKKVVETIIDTVNDIFGGSDGAEDTINSAEKGKIVYDNLQYGHYRVGEPITETNVFSSIYINATTNKIIETANKIWKIYCYPASTEDRWLYVDEKLVGTSSNPTGGVYLIDDFSFIVAGNTISSEDVLNIGSTQSNRVLQKSFFVPANRILVVTHSTYNSGSSLNVYETEFSSKVIDDIQDNAISTINGTLSVDAIPSSTNPLAFVKETPGYTSIFRTMGVIGGSMSSGTIYPGGSPEYSQIQYIARLCGSEGHNFGRGGMSARKWPKRDMIEKADVFKANPMSMYIIQLGNNDSGWNSDHPEYVIGEVGQVNGIDGTGTVTDVVDFEGDPGTAYPNYADTFCGQIGKILACIRLVSPKAHVFFSTFLRGYSSNQNFDYNQAIRDIYAFLSGSENIPTGDTLKYHLIDYDTYGTPYSSYSNNSDTIHKGTVSGSHLMASGYLLWAYEYCTYIDWMIKNNMSNFNDVASICKKIVYNLDNVTIDSVSVNGVALNPNYLPNYVAYGGTLELHLTAPELAGHIQVYTVKVSQGYGSAADSITNTSWDADTKTITISSVEGLITITAKCTYEEEQEEEEPVTL